MLITKQDCMNYILQNVPDYLSRWQAHQLYWGHEEAGLCNDIADFSHFVNDLFSEQKSRELKTIFSMVERLLTEGDEEVQTAIATCFLENLMNRTGSAGIQPAAIVPLLGKNSVVYCKAYNNFTGVSIVGL